MRKFIFLAVSLIMVISCTTINRHLQKKSALQEKAIDKNIIFMIVDGMGLEHIKAARIYNGQKPFTYEHFPCQVKVSTCSLDGADENGTCLANTTDVTDSAAAATAMATGHKVSNGAVSQESKDGQAELKTILEVAKDQGQSTGVIATKLFTDATPAAFVSHAVGRRLDDEILSDIFNETKPTLILGADNEHHRDAAKKSGIYRMVHNATDLKALSLEFENIACGDACPRVYGGFGQYILPGSNKKYGLPLEISAQEYAENDIPHLSQMTDAALKILNKNPRGFFLMVESSMPDMISHFNKQIDAGEGKKAIEALVKEMMEVEKTVQVLENFVVAHPNTLLIVTADHETGGLVVEEDKTPCLGQKDCVSAVKWTSAQYEPTKESASRHTPQDVNLYAIGLGATRFCKNRINNIDIPNLALDSGN